MVFRSSKEPAYPILTYGAKMKTRERPQEKPEFREGTRMRTSYSLRGTGDEGKSQDSRPSM